MTEGEGEDREKRPEDLFEDLDKFFAPIQGADWPVPEEEPSEPRDSDSQEESGPAEAYPSGGPTTEPETEPETEPAVSGTEIDEQTAATSSYQEPLTEDELPPIEAEMEAEREEVVIREYGYEETVNEGTDLEAETVLLEDDSIGGEADVEEAAAHFAGSFREDSGDIEEDILADLDAPAGQPVTVKVGATEGLRGPSWQEPTSEEVGVEPASSGPGRDVPAALLTGVALALVALVALAAGRVLFALVAGLVVLAAQGEFYAAITRRHHQPATALGLVSGALVLAGAYFHGEAGAIAMFGLGVVFTFVWFMATPVQHRVNVVANMSLTIFGVAWIPLTTASLMVLLQYQPSGRALVLSVLAMVFAYDTTAFAVGSLWGDHPLAPTVSPRKSREGAIIATIVVLIIAVAAVSSIDGVELAGAGLLAIAVAVLAPLGDLAESLVKRDLGIKDMGSILPGHGGVLDRIDSVLLVAPAALIILRMVLVG